MKNTILLLFLTVFLCIRFPFHSNGQAMPGDSVYNFVPQMPAYPDGQKGMLAYVVENMRYPLAAYMNGVSGTAYVNFIVEKNGSISDVHVLKPVGYGCDEEAVRLVSEMKGWTPGELEGKKVRVRTNMPVYFKEELYPESRISTKPDTMPRFPGGTEALSNYLKNETQYPSPAKLNSIRGREKVNFVVEKDGSVSNVMILDSLGYGCDNEAYRVVSAMPAWTPGYLEGAPVRTLLSVEVDFNDAYTIVEDMPQFPGGMEALYRQIDEKIIYPSRALYDSIEGRVFLNFIINEDGSLSNITVLNGPGHGLNEEAVRVIKSLPNWYPGRQGGKPVSVKYNLVVKFSLPEKE